MALAREAGRGAQRQGLQKSENLNSSWLLSLCVPKCWTNQHHVPVCVRVCECEGVCEGVCVRVCEGEGVCVCEGACV